MVFKTVDFDDKNANISKWANHSVKYTEILYHFNQTVSPGLENSTRPLVFTSASGCRASENFDISSEN